MISECLAPATWCGQGTEHELLEPATWHAPSWISVPTILRSSGHLPCTPFRAMPSPKGQQMGPVSCWARREQTGASLPATPHPTPATTSRPSGAWGTGGGGFGSPGF